MTTTGGKRKLIAILSADVKGYSHLMADDDEATVETLTAYRQVMTEVIEKHRGRVVDSPGDNLLAEFASVVDAMRGAVEIQEELRTRNAELSDHRRMEFRIGINLGDVIEEGGRIYGDGVNIAARVEGLADAGGICLSESAYQQVKNKLSLGIEYLGEHTVKNIAEPVPVYRLVLEPRVEDSPAIRARRAKPSPWKTWAVAALCAVVVAAVAVGLWRFSGRPSPPPLDVASIERMAFPLPDKPSIAVLPFVNMSGDPKQEFLADGISENLIAALSKISEMFVIARNSTFTYKGKPVKVQQVAEELGVRHVLEGSVQRSGDRLRVTAQLIDAITGHHLWSEIYDRKMHELFELLDGITKEIAVALQVKLTVGEQARNLQETDNLEAWGYSVRAYSLLNRITKEDMAKARELYEQAVALDPEFVGAWARLAWIHEIYSRRWGPSASRAEDLDRAAQLAEKALALDASHPEANAVMGENHLYRREYEQAIAWGKKAVAFGPNNAKVHYSLGKILHLAGKPEEAIPLFKQAMRLQPYYPWYYLLTLGSVYGIVGQYEEAIGAIKQTLARQDVAPYWRGIAHLMLARCYVSLDRIDEAQVQVQNALKRWPDFSLEFLSKRLRKVAPYPGLFIK
jgi:TolB-like protein/class 3 adenylate cyclase